MDERPPYHSWLLRLWQVKENGKKKWRASLQWVGSENRRNFESLDSLLAFLNEITRGEADYVLKTDHKS